MIGIDGGAEKGDFVLSLGAKHYLDFRTSSNLTSQVLKLTRGGANAVIVTAGSSKAFAQAVEMLKAKGTLCCVGIPPDGGCIETPISTIVIKGVHITGNLVGSLKECLEAVDFVRRGSVQPHITVRPFKDLPAVYDELERGQISGRVVLKVAEDEHDGF